MIALVKLGDQYVDPAHVVAILLPTSHHVDLTAGAPISLYSVLVLDTGTLVPCSLPPDDAAKTLAAPRVVDQPARPQARASRA